MVDNFKSSYMGSNLELNFKKRLKERFPQLQDTVMLYFFMPQNITMGIIGKEAIEKVTECFKSLSITFKNDNCVRVGYAHYELTLTLEDVEKIMAVIS